MSEIDIVTHWQKQAEQFERRAVFWENLAEKRSYELAHARSVADELMATVILLREKLEAK